MADLLREENLDDLDPLRHLRGSADADDADLVPAQPPSILDQTIELTFPSDTSETVSITLAVDASPGCGGIAWPAGEVLSRYIARKGPAYFKDKTVLELGSGTGLVGLVAAKLGAPRVWLTDQAPLLATMRRNTALNGLAPPVRVAELNWGAPLPLLPRPDVVLAADCVYFEPAFPLLVRTLAALVPRDAPGPDADVLFCYKKRRKADRRFFALLRKEFTWTEVLDDPDRDVYAREAISLLRLSRRR
ncbi:hypothetical protein IEO21_03330 [Rhodonia placenta]|uniref:Protein-lysine N-methyltransferase EFM6 n=1 Tax=Rhodonia placenta TaxID=104341 RepID=A0A8H7P6C6_9APHY|nr:hypothetical protein IEO21_03330 [Postia placenta]